MRNPWRTPQRLWGLSLMLISVGSLVALDSVAIAAQPPETEPSATSQNSKREEQIAQVIQRRVVPTVISPNVTVPNSGAPTAPTPVPTQTQPASSPQPTRRAPSRTRWSFPVYRTTTPTSTPSAPTQSAPTQAAPAQSTPTQSAPTQSAPTQSAPTQSAPTQSVASIATYRAELLRLTNLERQRAGLRPLTLSTSLGQAAQAHSVDMAQNQVFSHTGSNGSTVSSRTRAAGYAYSYVGENIAWGYGSPEAAIRAWMNSPGHRANILRPEYTEIGFGYTNASSGQYRHYWVQVFGARR